jgi:hypothetical protein
MECPYCNYTHGDHWDEDKGFHCVKGIEGSFFELTNGIKAIRESLYEKDTKKIYGCPNCNKLFMYSDF